MPDYSKQFDGAFGKALNGFSHTVKPVERPKPEPEDIVPETPVREERVLEPESFVVDDIRDDGLAVVDDGEPESPARPVVSPAGPKSKAGRRNDSDIAYVRLPKNLVSTVKAMMGGTANQNTAVAAYLYIMLGRSLPVDDEIRELADGFEDDSGVSDLRNDLSVLSGYVKNLAGQQADSARLVSELQLGIVWLICERMAMGVDLHSPPEKMNFLSPEAEAMLARLQKQGVDRANREKARKGREIYESKFGGKTEK